MTVYLITGASRGIGYGLVEHLLKLPESIVIATCRSPSTTTVFDELQQNYGSRLVVMMLDVTSEWAFEVLKGQLVEKSINSIDVLIANAGIAGNCYCYLT
jgi:norsolorinic acid ketoreductase